MIFTACENDFDLEDDDFDYGSLEEAVEIPDDLTTAIKFADTNTKHICLMHWDRNQDGELSYEEASYVTSLNMAFGDEDDNNPNPDNDYVVTFAELKYFTNLTEIGVNAFYGCQNLKKVSMPEKIQTIRASAFKGCAKLKAVAIGKSANEITDEVSSSNTTRGGESRIDDYAFWGCSDLVAIALPGGITYIGKSAFEGCTSLISVTIGNSVTQIGESAFRGCTSLTGITIPDSVTEIGDSTFSGCSSLTSITIPNSVTEIGDYAFGDCSSLTSVTIPDSVTSIGEWAFTDCDMLTNITIPNSVTKLGGAVFMACDKLSTFSGKFASADGRCLIVDGEINSFAPGGLTEYTLPDDITSIGTSCFVRCNNITTIVLPDGLKVIKSEAFQGSENLKSIVIPDSVELIDAVAFAECDKLADVTIGNGVTTIGEGAFWHCDSLKSITIPDSIISLSSDAFNECYQLEAFYGKFASEDHRCLIINGELKAFASAGLSKLDEYTVPAGIKTLPRNIFEGAQFGKVNLPESVTDIFGYSFKNCKNLTTVNIPDSVNTIGEAAFQGCISLNTIVIPANVTLCEMGIFDGCINMEKLYCKMPTPPGSLGQMGNKVKFYVPSESYYIYCSKWGNEYGKENIFAYDFENGTIVEESEIPLTNNKIFYTTTNDTMLDYYDVEAMFGAPLLSHTYENGQGIIAFAAPVTMMHEEAFRGNGSLKSIVIPELVAKIENYAFYGCTSLESITIGNGVTSIGRSAFEDCTSLTSVYCKPTTPPTGLSYMFNQNASGRKIYVPRNSVEAYKAAQYWSDYSSDIVGYDF